MKNKQLVSDNLDKLRNKIKNINYVYSTNGSLQEFREAVEISLNTLGEIEGLISIEHDLFASNQIL